MITKNNYDYYSQVNEKQTHQSNPRHNASKVSFLLITDPNFFLF